MKYIGTHRFWMKEAGMTYILPYIHITVERIQHFYSLGIEAGWLNKWCSIQFSFIRSATKHNSDLLRILIAFVMVWGLVITIAIMSPIILIYSLMKAYEQYLDGLFGETPPRPVMWVDVIENPNATEL